VSLGDSHRVDELVHVHEASFELVDLAIALFELVGKLFLLLAELLASDGKKFHFVLVVHELGSDAAEFFLPLVDLGHVGAGLEAVLLHDVLLAVGEAVDLLLHFFDLAALLLGEADLLGEGLLAPFDLSVLVCDLGLEVVVFLPRTSQLDLDVTQTLLQLLYLRLRYLHRLPRLVLKGLPGT
jgi:hypothetical protein